MGIAAGAIILAGGYSAALLAGAAVVGFCYGGNFAVYPAEVAHLYGQHRMGTIYAMVLFAQGISGLVGPALGGLSMDLFHTFWPGLVVAACIGIAGCVLFVRNRPV
jgi:OFA family oxalate/formate antiporter-like MFS transporter